MIFVLSNNSYKKLEGVHPDLVKVVERAITLTDVDFGVTEGVRTITRQKQLFDNKATTTMHSRHLTGHAVDLVAYIGPEVRWDWPLYSHIATAMKKSVMVEGVHIEWGGDWKTFKDGPHFQLPWKEYP